jgi:hypothetical protein
MAKIKSWLLGEKLKRQFSLIYHQVQKKVNEVEPKCFKYFNRRIDVSPFEPSELRGTMFFLGAINRRSFITTGGIIKSGLKPFAAKRLSPFYVGRGSTAYIYICCKNTRAQREQYVVAQVAMILCAQEFRARPRCSTE